MRRTIGRFLVVAALGTLVALFEHAARAGGSLCGNGILDPGERCDDGGAGTGCCSPSCLFEPAGTTCVSDGDVCTSDVCDGAGTCTHGNACDDGDACTDDTCTPGTGACFHTPLAGGCDDGNSCTTDSCDPAIGCVHVPVADGTACDNGDRCGPDACTAGECQNDKACAVTTVEQVAPSTVLMTWAPATATRGDFCVGQVHATVTGNLVPISTRVRRPVAGVPLHAVLKLKLNARGKRLLRAAGRQGEPLHALNTMDIHPASGGPRTIRVLVDLLRRH